MAKRCHSDAIDGNEDFGQEEHVVSEPFIRDDSEEEEEDDMRPFREVLKQLNFDGIRSIAASVRQMSLEKASKASISNPTTPSRIGCKVFKTPLFGSFNLVYEVKFDDGVRWMMKIPASGHRDAWDTLASESLTSEALTVRLIGQNPNIPVPPIHHFDASMDNEIGCPYILMEKMRGKALYDVWFNDELSVSKQENVRLRSLRTIAVAMVALSEFQFDKSGSLRFDSQGKVIGHGRAKVIDCHGLQERQCNGENLTDLYCGKDPTEDPLSSILSMLDRRGTKSYDNSLNRGAFESLRTFINWTFNCIRRDKEGFALAHTDLDTQNVLVADDGTLCGIIDWDGVAAVPHSVGPLKYPIWLMRDWSPDDSHRENTPEDLERYREMYAQFIEAAVMTLTNDRTKSKRTARVTRASLLLGSLELAANSPWFTDGIIQKTFRGMEAAVNEMGGDDASQTDSSSSSEGEDEDDEDSEEDEFDGDSENDFIAVTDTKQNIAGGTNDVDTKIHCPGCIADEARPSKDQEMPPEGALPRRGSDRPSQEAPLKESPEAAPTSEDASPELVVPQSSPSSAAAHSDSGVTDSTKVHLAKFFCNLGAKGCRGLATKLHRKGVVGGPVREGHVIGPSKDDSGLSIAKSAIMGAIDSLFLKIQEELSQDKTTVLPCSEEGAMNNHVKAFLKKLLRILGNTMCSFFANEGDPPSARDVDAAHPEKGVELDMETQDDLIVEVEAEVPAEATNETSETNLNALEHSTDCPKAAMNESYTPESTEHPIAEIGFQDVWAGIGRELQNAGISVAMIKDDQAMIADWIINTTREKRRKREEEAEAEEVRREAEAEKAKRKKKKARKAERKAKEAEKEATETLAASNKAEPEAMEIDERVVEINQQSKNGPSGEVGNVGRPKSVVATKQAESLATNIEAAEEEVGSEEAAEKAAEDSASEQMLSQRETNPTIEESEAVTVVEPRTRDQNAIPPLKDSVEGKIPDSADDMRKIPGVPGKPVTESIRQAPIDDQLYPRNKPCPCGSRHKFKKCCGRAKGSTDLEKVEAAEVTKEVGINSPKSPNSDSRSADSLTASPGKSSSKTSDSGSEDGHLKEGAGPGNQVSATPEGSDKDACEKVRNVDSDEADLYNQEVGDYQKASVELDGSMDQDIGDHGGGAPAEASGQHSGSDLPTGEGLKRDAIDGSIENRDAIAWMAPEKDQTWSLDRGEFDMTQILVALGKGELDIKRRDRLRARFRVLLCQSCIT